MNTYKTLKLEVFGSLSFVLGFFSNLLITPCFNYSALFEGEAWAVWFILWCIQSIILFAMIYSIIYICERINKQKTAHFIISVIRKSNNFTDKMFQDPYSDKSTDFEEDEEE